MQYLCANGHARVYEYGWSWFVSCLEAAAAQEKRACKRRVSEIAAGTRLSGEKLDAMFSEENT